MIIDKLRADTRYTHEQLEQEMLPMIREAVNMESYARLLRIFYGYYKPLEDSIAQYISPRELPDFADRRKTSLILEDLSTIGQPTGNIPIDLSVPAIDCPEAAFGALYVMEGSTLGGKVICKMIAENLGVKDHDGLSFFYGYGGQTGSRWKDFLARLDAFSDQPGELLVIRSANAVFTRFQHWIKEKK